MAGSTLRKQRSACDRCNSLKLKCPRLGDAESCSRCIRASAACTFSPSMRGLKPQARERELRRLGLEVANHSNSNGQAQQVGRSVPDNLTGTRNDDVDPSLTQADQWDFEMLGMTPGDAANPFYNFRGQENSSPARSQDQANNNLGHQTTIDMSLDTDWTNGQDFEMLGPPESLPDPIHHPFPDITPIDHGKPPTVNKSVNRRFTEIFIQLENHAANLPPMPIDQTQERFDESAAAINAEWWGKGRPFFSIQQLFESSQDLVDTYPEFCEEHFGSSIQLLASQKDSPRILSNKKTRVDHASIFLGLSCYHQLVDVWTSVFCQVEYGTKMGKFSRDRISRQSMCQRLRIGSFVPKTKVPLEIVLAVEFQKQLVDQLCDLDKKVESATRSVAEAGGQAAHLGAVHGMTKELVTRATKLLDEALRIQTMVENSNSPNAGSTSPDQAV